MSKPLLFWLSLLLVFSGSYTLWVALRASQSPPAVVRNDSETSQPHADELLDKQRTLDEFELTDQLGRTFRSSELDGQVWVGSFFFSACPSVCIRQNQAVQQLQTRFGDRGLKLVSITCDPKRDTPVALALYSRQFNADPDAWRFLTGDLAYIQKVAREFFLISIGEQAHGSHLVLFDRQGKLRGAYGATNEARFQELCEAIEQLLDESDASHGEGDTTPVGRQGESSAQT